MSKSRTIVVVLALIGASWAQITKEDIEYVNKTFFPATVLLYSQDEHGGMNMRCTATAIRPRTGQPAGTTTFVTAAHCACEDDTEKELAKPKAHYFFVTSDEKDEKKFMAAKLEGCGYQHKGVDVAFFLVKTTDYPFVEVGKDPVVMDPVVNVASPLGLGKQVFTGTVTSPMVDREIVQGDINWTKAVLVQIPGTDGGSSGSAIVCLQQKAICAFLVGMDNDSTMVAMPVGRMAAFREELASGKYKYWKDDQDFTPVKADRKAKSVVIDSVIPVNSDCAYIWPTGVKQCAPK